MARFLKWLAQTRTSAFSNFTRTDLVPFRDYLLRGGGAASVNLALATIQSALSKAFNDRLVDVNEASRVPRLGDDPQRTERRAFTDRELRAILKAADLEWRGMTLVGAYTGMRLGDVSMLCWQNVELESREFRWKTEKTDRDMIIPIAEPLLRYLLEIAGDDPTAPVFPQSYGLPTGTLSNRFYRIMVKAGVVEKRTNKAKERPGRRASGGLGFHCLRHTATSLLKQAGASDGIAMEIIGHETAAISRTYSHIDTPTLRIAIDKMPDLTA